MELQDLMYPVQQLGTSEWRSIFFNTSSPVNLYSNLMKLVDLAPLFLAHPFPIPRFLAVVMLLVLFTCDSFHNNEA
jgi:hypothetical protein